MKVKNPKRFHNHILVNVINPHVNQIKIIPISHTIMRKKSKKKSKVRILSYSFYLNKRQYYYSRSPKKIFINLKQQAYKQIV